MSDDETKAQEAPSTREKILVATREIFTEDGVEGITMRAVARRAGIGTMTTYRYFESRETLLSELVAEGFLLFQSYVQRALVEPDPVERLWKTSEHYLDFALNQPRYYELMFSYTRPLSDLPLEREERREVAAALQFLVNGVVDCRGGDIEHAARDAMSLWSLAHGLVSLYRAGRYGADFDFPEFYKTTIAHMFRGMGFIQ